jgi:hypothetical protein
MSNALPDFASMNETERKAYFDEEQKKQQSLIDSSIKAKATMGALRVRPVFTQAIDSAKNASTTSAVSHKTAPLPAFSGSSSSSTNMMRLAFVDNPFRVQTHFGINGFIPDVNHLFLLLSMMDAKMVSTRKFIEGCEFWLPFISQYYMSVIVYLQIFRAMDAAGILTGQALDVYEIFCGLSSTVTLSSLPVPGPFLNFLSQISAHLPHLADMSTIVPAIPCDLVSTNNDYYYFTGTCANLIGRLPNVPVILSQFRTAANNDFTAANQGRILNHSIIGGMLFDTTAAPGNAALWNTPVAFTTPASMMSHFGQDPSSRYPVFISGPLITQFETYRAMASPPTFPNRAATGNPNLTWTTFLGLNNMGFFLDCVRIMTWYSKYWQGSTSFSQFAANGHTGGQSEFTLNTQEHDATLRAGRFPAHDFTFKGKSRNPLAPDSDSFDAALAPINLNSLHDRQVGHSATYQYNNPAQRIGGPFFELSTTHVTGDLKPSNAYAGLLTNYYYSSVALKN